MDGSRSGDTHSYVVTGPILLPPVCVAAESSNVLTWVGGCSSGLDLDPALTTATLIVAAVFRESFLRGLLMGSTLTMGTLELYVARQVSSDPGQQ